MNILRIAVSLALAAALGANAQSRFEKTDEQVKADGAEATCAGAIPANHGSAIKVDEDSTRRRLKEPRPTTKQALRPPSRIMSFDPLLPFGQ